MSTHTSTSWVLQSSSFVKLISNKVASDLFSPFYFPSTNVSSIKNGTMSSEAREFEFNKTWFVEGDFPTLKFMVAYYLGSRDFFFGGRVFSVLHKIEWWCDELILTLVIFWRKKQIVKMKNKIACFRYKNVTSVLTCYLVPT